MAISERIWTRKKREDQASVVFFLYLVRYPNALIWEKRGVEGGRRRREKRRTCKRHKHGQRKEGKNNKTKTKQGKKGRLSRYTKKNTRNVSLLSVLLVIRSPSSSLGEVCSERAGHSTSVAFSTPDKKRQRVGNTQRHGPQQRVFSEKGGVEE